MTQQQLNEIRENLDVKCEGGECNVHRHVPAMIRTIERLERHKTALLAALKETDGMRRICWCCANDSESAECQTCKHCCNWRFDYERFGGAVDAEVQ
jgi:hypothetical protein